MLPKKFRLQKNVRFLNAHLIQTEYFSLRYMKGSKTYTRAGFVISKKTNNTAVGRNKIKRRFRGCFEMIYKSLLPYDMLFVLKKDAISTPTNILCQKLMMVLSAEKLIQQ